MRLWALAACLALAGCQQPAEQPLSVEDAWVRLPAASGRPAAAYFTLKGGKTEEQLISVGSPLAIRSELHDMKMEGGVMKMAPMEGGVSLPAGGTVAFAPGGKHVMLFDISPDASPSKPFPLTLRFASGATLETDARAQAPGDPAPAEDHAH